MRILYLSSVYPRPGDPNHGVYNRKLLEALPPGHQARVVAPVPWTAVLRPGAARLGVPPRGDGAPELWTERPPFVYPPGALKTSHGWLMWRSARGAVRRAVDGFPPDIVLSYWAYPDGEAAVRTARDLGVPAALKIGGSDVLLLGRKPGPLRRCFLRTLRAADALLTVSEDLRSRVVALGADPARVHTFYQGVDASAFRPGDRAAARRRLGLPAEARVVLWVGRMVPVKGLDVLLDAAARLRRAVPGLRVCLVGGGPERPSLEARAAAEGLSGVVDFAGERHQDALPDWYRAADLTVLPSYSEGVPNVLRESLACGTPFVASRVGGIPELTSAAWGRLVPPGDPSALAGELERALAAGAPAGQPGFRESSWAASAENLVRTLQKHARAGAAAPPWGVRSEATC
jgi:glycosyltransferase involved in cell wall biosynthesis